MVQCNAMRCWETGEDFRELVKKDPEMGHYFTTEEIKEIFRPEYYLRYVDAIMDRTGIQSERIR